MLEVIYNFIGYVAAGLTTFSFVPQVIKIIKSRQTNEISLGMYVLYCFGVFLWMVYGILRQDIPLITANAVTLMLASVVLWLKIKWG